MTANTITSIAVAVVAFVSAAVQAMRHARINREADAPERRNRLRSATRRMEKTGEKARAAEQRLQAMRGLLAVDDSPAAREATRKATAAALLEVEGLQREVLANLKTSSAKVAEDIQAVEQETAMMAKKIASMQGDYDKAMAAGVARREAEERRRAEEERQRQKESTAAAALIAASQTSSFASPSFSSDSSSSSSDYSSGGGGDFSGGGSSGDW